MKWNESFLMVQGHLAFRATCCLPKFFFQICIATTISHTARHPHKSSGSKPYLNPYYSKYTHHQTLTRKPRVPGCKMGKNNSPTVFFLPESKQKGRQNPLGVLPLGQVFVAATFDWSLAFWKNPGSKCASSSCPNLGLCLFFRWFFTTMGMKITMNFTSIW